MWKESIWGETAAGREGVGVVVITAAVTIAAVGVGATPRARPQAWTKRTIVANPAINLLLRKRMDAS
jgi:hypothetical protein